MRTTIGHTPLETPYLAVPPPAARNAPDRARPAAHPMRHAYRRHLATFGAMAMIALVILAVDWLIAPARPDAPPLWLILLAAVGTIAVGTSVRRLERRWRPSPRDRRIDDRATHGTASPGRPSHASGTPRLHAQHYAAATGWRYAVGVAVAAASAASLLLALALPEGARPAMLATGLAGVLALRFVVPPRRTLAIGVSTPAPAAREAERPNAGGAR